MPLIVAAAFVALVLLMTVGLPSTSPAYADEYPTWEEVKEARKDVASAQAKVKEITALLAKLEVAAAEAEMEAARLGEIYYEALAELDDATYRQELLQTQADEAAGLAEESRMKAGQFVAELARVGGADLTATLLLAVRMPRSCSVGSGMPRKSRSKPMAFTLGRWLIKTRPSHLVIRPRWPAISGKNSRSWLKLRMRQLTKQRWPPILRSKPNLRIVPDSKHS